MNPYSIPPTTKLIFANQRPLLTTADGGKIALDATLISLWQAADQHTLDEVIQGFQDEHATTAAIKCGLACLAEAGLLARNEESPQTPVLPGGTRTIGGGDHRRL